MEPLAKERCGLPFSNELAGDASIFLPSVNYPRLKAVGFLVPRPDLPIRMTGRGSVSTGGRSRPLARALGFPAHAKPFQIHPETSFILG
jgi:hypothetical protein